MGRAFIDLKNVIRTKDDLRKFADQVLEHFVDESQAHATIAEHELKGVASSSLPFTEDALERMAEAIFGHEDSRSPRRIIDALGKLASAAYQESKSKKKYVLVDRSFAEPILRSY